MGSAQQIARADDLICCRNSRGCGMGESLVGRAPAVSCIKLAYWHFANHLIRLYRRYAVLCFRLCSSVSARRCYYLGTRGGYLSGDGVMASLHAFPSHSVVQLTCPQPQPQQHTRRTETMRRAVDTSAGGLICYRGSHVRPDAFLSSTP